MSYEASTWVWEHAKASGNDLIVLLKIADNANADGGGAYPGIAYLARTARISKRAVYDCLRRLKAAGELIEEEGGGGRGHKTIYRVLMGSEAKGAASAPNPEHANGAAPRAETVQPAALNGADSGSAYKEEPPLNPPENLPPAAASVPAIRVTSRDLLAEHLDALGHDLATKGQLAATIKRLLERVGVPADEVRGALALMRERGLTSPNVLSALVDEVRGGGKRQRPPERYALNGDHVTPPAQLKAWAERRRSQREHVVPELEARP